MKTLVIVMLAGWMFLLCSFSLGAGSVDVSASYLPYATGGYLVEFTASNHLDTEYLQGLTVHSSNRSSAWGPEGWYTYITYRYVAWGTEQQQCVILPGMSKSGFQFVEDAIPSQYDWWAMGSDFNYIGSVTPTPIPEPSSLLALGGGLMGLGLLRKRVTSKQ